MNPEEQEALGLLRQDFSLEFSGDPDSSRILQQLADQVAHFLENKPDLLFSYFYRMDIDEQEVAQILQEPQEEPVNLMLAQLIFNRQVARARTKIQYRQPPLDWELDEDSYTS